MNELALTKIRIDGGTQSRAEIDHETVAEYAEAMKIGAKFPGVIVYFDGNEYWLADGFHRYFAAEMNMAKSISVEVRQGTQREAILHSCGANADHGLRRTNADKRRAVMRLLADDEWNQWSDREIARRCGVDHKFVGKLRSELTGDRPQLERTYTTKHGTVATMNTSNIGKPAVPPKGDPDKKVESHDDIPLVDGEPITLTHPYSYEHMYRGSTIARCRECNEAHPNWKPAKASWWVCGECGVATKDDQMLLLSKEEALAGQRGHSKPRPSRPPEAKHSYHAGQQVTYLGQPAEVVGVTMSSVTLKTAERGIFIVEGDDANLALPEAAPTLTVGTKVITRAGHGGTPTIPQHLSKSQEWYTPAPYVEAARLLMGAIDLDPASCDYANRTVQAARYYSIDDDGLAHEWTGRVWLNPPYGRNGDWESNQAVWSARLIGDYKAGRVSEAVLLVNATPAAAWFQPLWDYLICFTDHRIEFVNEAGETQDSPTHGNAFVYFGQRAEAFADIFSQFGTVIWSVYRKQAVRDTLAGLFQTGAAS